MRRLARPGVGAVLSACLLAALPAAAQEPKARLADEGSLGFRHLLNLRNLQPLQRLADLAGVSPKETVLVVFGDTRMLVEAVRPHGGLEQFHRRGGAILIATDRPDRERLKQFKVTINGHGVYVPLPVLNQQPALVYRDTNDCPMLPDVVGMTHPLFQGLRQGIATNRPSYLIPHAECDLLVLASFPSACQDRYAGPAREPLPFILGTSDGQQPGANEPAPLLILAGHGVFMDGMVGPHQDNWVFARNCVNWLTRGGKRKYALFLEEGAVVRNFNVPLIQLPVPPLEAVYGMIRGLEEENFFNQVLLDNVDRTQLLKWLLLGISAPLLLYALARRVGAHQRGAGKTPLVAAHAAEVTLDLPAVAQRQEHVLEDGNCWEAARDLARLCFEGHAGGDQPEAPPVAIRGGRRLRRAAARLWQLAYGAPVYVAPKQFGGLLLVLARVRAALDDGALAEGKRKTE